MTTDWRALCAELADALHNAIRVIHHEDGTLHISTAEPVLARARAALAEPEPEGPPQPIAVSERLPGPEDCDAEGRCWLHGKVEGEWRLINVANPGVPKLSYCFSHWLPAHALPTPTIESA